MTPLLFIAMLFPTKSPKLIVGQLKLRAQQKLGLVDYIITVSFREVNVPQINAEQTLQGGDSELNPGKIMCPV